MAKGDESGCGSLSFTEKYPQCEIYGLTSQTRRSAVSLPSNIAEGRYRGSKKDFRQFLIIAYASGQNSKRKSK